MVGKFFFSLLHCSAEVTICYNKFSRWGKIFRDNLFMSPRMTKRRCDKIFLKVNINRVFIQKNFVQFSFVLYYMLFSYRTFLPSPLTDIYCLFPFLYFLLFITHLLPSKFSILSVAILILSLIPFLPYSFSTLAFF